MGGTKGAQTADSEPPGSGNKNVQDIALFYVIVCIRMSLFLYIKKERIDHKF